MNTGWNDRRGGKHNMIRAEFCSLLGRNSVTKGDPWKEHIPSGRCARPGIHAAGKTSLETFDTTLSSTISLRMSFTGDSVINKTLNQQLLKGALEFTTSISDNFGTCAKTTDNAMKNMVSNLC
jgi:hypothetical protein